MSERIGVISVEDFNKAVGMFGFDSPVVTAVWNTMAKNDSNQKEFEEIYARWSSGEYRAKAEGEKSMVKYNELEDVLGECFDYGLLPKIEKEWRAFYEEPRKYAGTVVVEMVNQWIDEQPLNWKGE